MILYYTAGHHMNTSNLTLVLQKMRRLHRLSNLLRIPEDTLTSYGDERINKVSESILSEYLKWRDLKHLLLRCKEKSAIDFVCLMEQYVREGELSRL